MPSEVRVVSVIAPELTECSEVQAKRRQEWLRAEVEHHLEVLSNQPGLKG